MVLINADITHEEFQSAFHRCKLNGSVRLDNMVKKMKVRTVSTVCTVRADIEMIVYQLSLIRFDFHITDSSVFFMYFDPFLL